MRLSSAFIKKITVRIIGDYNSRNQNTRKSAVTAGYNVIGQVIQVITGLISVPLTISYLGAERFGYWMAISAILSFAAISDFGLSIGAQDRISKLLAIKKNTAACLTFLTALIASTLIAIIIVTCSEIVIILIDLSSLFNLQEDETIREAGNTARALAFVIASGIVSGVVQRSFFAAQLGHLIAAAIAVSRVISLIGVIFVIKMQWGLPALVIAYGGLSNIAVIAFIPVLVFLEKWYKLNGRRISILRIKGEFKKILNVGLYGLLAAIAYLLLSNSIILVISTKYGAAEVATYAVLAKLTAIPSALLANIFSPIWPAVTNASVNTDKIWLLQTYSLMRVKTIYFSLFFFIAFMILIPSVILWWTGDERLVPSYELLASSLIFMVLNFWNTFYSTFLNGLSSYKLQAIVAIITASLSFLIALMIAPMTNQSFIILVIALGFFLRCLSMRREIIARLSVFERV